MKNYSEITKKKRTILLKRSKITEDIHNLILISKDNQNSFLVSLNKLPLIEKTFKFMVMNLKKNLRKVSLMEKPTWEVMRIPWNAN